MSETKWRFLKIPVDAEIGGTWEEGIKFRFLEPEKPYKFPTHYVDPKKYKLRLTLAQLWAQNGGMVAATIADIRRQLRTFVDIEIREAGHVHVMFLDADPVLEATLRDNLPIGIYLTTSTLDDLIENGERLMRHFRGD